MLTGGALHPLRVDIEEPSEIGSVFRRVLGDEDEHAPLLRLERETYRFTAPVAAGSSGHTVDGVAVSLDDE